mgnify:CR=1 FL=1
MLSFKILFSFEYISTELPIGLTDEEKGRMHIIKEMVSVTQPPSAPIRSIAEFEPMQGVLIRYPFGISTNLIRAIAEDVKVYCLVSSGSQNSASNSMNNAGVDMNNVEFILGSTDSYWTRDYGPWWIVDGDNQVGIVDFTYNRPRPNDNQAPSKTANHLNTPYFASGIISTGGNYMTDGYGISASTHIAYTENDQCNTNNQSSIPLPPCAYVDDNLKVFYGIDTYHVVSDPNNEYIDHIDCWGKYLSPSKVLIREVPSWHSQYDEIEAVAEYFGNSQTIFGKSWEVFRVYTGSNQPYTNSLILNNKVFVPIMNNSYDDDAIAVYEEALPGYEVLGFTGSWESTDALHCRIRGIPDLEMLQIFHAPIDDQDEPQEGYLVNANIESLSDSGLIAEELKVIWWIDGFFEPQTLIMNSCSEGTDNCFSATIPSQMEDGKIKYYIQAIDNSGKLEKLPMAGYFDFNFLGGGPFEQGDLNNDSTTNILDIVLMVNIVLNSEQNSNADLNSDGTVNILDVILLVNIILEN